MFIRDVSEQGYLAVFSIHRLDRMAASGKLKGGVSLIYNIKEIEVLEVLLT